MLLLSIKSALVVAFMVYDKKALRISEGKPKSQLKLRIAHCELRIFFVLDYALRIPNSALKKRDPLLPLITDH